MYQRAIKIAYLLSVLSVSIAFSTTSTTSTVPAASTAPAATIVKPNTMISASNNYFTPLNDSFDIYKYKLFEIKNNRLNPFSTFANHFRSLFYPYERKIPLYYYVHTNTSQSI
jgi:hypothetical protein